VDSVNWHLNLETRDGKEIDSFKGYLLKNGVSRVRVEVETPVDKPWIYRLYISSKVQQRKQRRLADEWMLIYRGV
jgi:hypothetical protein